MKSERQNNNNAKVALITSFPVIIAFLCVDVYVILNKESIVAKSLALVSFVGIMFVLLPSLKWIFKLRE